MTSSRREVVRSASAPEAVGPYSQAIRANGFVFLSGQIPLDRATGKLVDGPIEAQTHRVMGNLESVLEAAGSSFEDVVKTTIFVVDLKDFAAVNQVYSSYFTAVPPARSTVQVAALPLGARIEIEMVALGP
ncbi:MAG TPA: RidA family protein [Polyangiaceae bacterium]|jgi:2-iminobutanoate/2-iminopropanoate deaminase|nr:RidA family protein [Polyangiaceae bacterium]